MALKNNWNDLVDGESFVEVDPINRMAHAIIANEENILSVQKLSESIQAENKSQEVEINELSKDLTRFEIDAVRLNSKINENEKRITNLEKGIPSDLFLTDSSIAYSKNVPQNALPYAEVRKIGGMTRKCTNLLPYPYDDTTHAVNGITFVDNGDGTITANGTATENATYFMKNSSLSLSAGKYTISGLPFDGSWTTAITQLASSNGFAFNNFLAQGETFTLDSEVNDMIVVLVVFKGYTANNLVFKPMLNEGSTALPYEPYFEGLRSAPVTEVESAGVNLFPSLTERTVSGVTIAKDANGVYHFSGTATALVTQSFDVYLPKGAYSLHLNCSKVVGTNASNTLYAFGTNQAGWALQVYGCDDNIASSCNNSAIDRITFAIPSGVNLDGVTIAPMLNEGMTALPYRPYTRHTLPIPEAVQALDGYGEGNPDNAEEDNAIIWENGKRKYIHKGDITDNVWKSLATPEITDISDLISEDNFIGVEGNGTITMINQYKYDVPSEIVFMLNEV